MPFSLNKKYIIVNYHYVEDPREDFSGINPSGIEEFDKQIEFLSKNYRFTDIKSVYAAAQHDDSDRLCSITFDDGLKVQYQNAVPILEKHNATATFFIITSVLDGNLPSTHKIHTLLSNTTAERLVDACNSFFKEAYPQNSEYIIPKDRRITMKRKLRDDVITANFKETINQLPSNVEEKCLQHLIDTEGLETETIASELFMSEREIKELSLQGFSTECHSYSHNALDTQNKEAMQENIHMSKKRLEEITENPVTVLSYPHGGYNERVIRVTRDEGFTHAVTIERREVQRGDNPFIIPRYDTKDIVF